MAVFVEGHKLNYIPRPCPAKEVYKAQANHYEKRLIGFLGMQNSEERKWRENGISRNLSFLVKVDRRQGRGGG